MSAFIIRFLFCNVLITLIIGAITLLKYGLRTALPARTQYHLWFLVLGMMTVPFLPFQFSVFSTLSKLLSILKSLPYFWNAGMNQADNLTTSSSRGYAALLADDFAVSVTRGFSTILDSSLGTILCVLWCAGMCVMIFSIIRSVRHLHALRKSALPLQHPQILLLLQGCKSILGITKEIRIYSTPFLKSPMTIGILHPRIYLPTHLISDFAQSDKESATQIQHILLHELQHLRSMDALPNLFMNILGILYWFNPVVWYAFRSIRAEREIACDSAVLQMLSPAEYESYGMTLIQFAEKISSPYFTGNSMGGSFRQIRKRIVNIVAFHPMSRGMVLRGRCLYGLVTVLLLCLSPLLSTYAAVSETYETYQFDTSGKQMNFIDASSYFQDYEGSFVCYDAATDSWTVYNEDYALRRVSPDSTYKIYEGLMGLDAGIITPAKSILPWDGTAQPFDAWNADQDLRSAMQHSVNWYFEDLGNKMGTVHVQDSLTRMHYGNENLSGGSDYWMESSLKISPMEQVELLERLNNQELSAHSDSTAAIKDAMLLFSDSTLTFYGKTGTGRVQNQDISGWFVGFVEKGTHTYYFATHIQGLENATGTEAAAITRAILSELQIL
ncbi:MAG: BlaR1 family beta-lactam sensor/signal transducer [Lachnospiraceae bacterium]|nr:BlaR1 family beta-lactam sensor/signal transducer [Lachnospiraceae bacterium]